MKRKLTEEQKRRKKEYKTIFRNGKQVRVKRLSVLREIEADEFYMNNADPIMLHQDGMWEYMNKVDKDEFNSSEYLSNLANLERYINKK